MRKLIVIAVLCALPLTAFSHPGKTDKYGGHKCVKGCEAWGLDYAEYHLHDKDWKPIHVSKKKNLSDAPVMRSAATETALAAPIVTSKTETVTVYRYITTVQEENIIASNPLLWALLVLLLLLLILLRNHKEQDSRNKA